MMVEGRVSGLTRVLECHLGQMLKVKGGLDRVRERSECYT